MDRPSAINNCQPNITVCGHIVRGIDLIPHSPQKAWERGICFDLTQFCGNVGKVT